MGVNVAMTRQQVIDTIEDEAMCVVRDVFSKEKLVLTERHREELVRNIRRCVRHTAGDLVDIPEATIRSAMKRVILTHVPPLRVS